MSRTPTSFWPAGGSMVWRRAGRWPGIASVPLGAFDPTFPEPRFSIWEERRHPRVRIGTQGPLERMR